MFNQALSYVNSKKNVQSFPSCSVKQAYSLSLFTLASFDSTVNLIHNLTSIADLSIYLWACVLIIIFGLSYKDKTAGELLSRLSTWGELSAIFVITINVVYLVYILTSYSLLNVSLDNYYHFSYYSVVIKLLLSLIWLGLSRFSSSVSNFISYGIAELPLLSYLALAFSITVVSVSHLVIFLICLEGLSLILYIIATIGRLQGGIAGATKYFAFGTLGSVLIFWGTVHLYELTSSLSYSVLFSIFEQISLTTISTNLSIKLLWAGSLILIGLLIKLGASPTHQWVPDVYFGVPTFVTSFYAIFIKVTIYVLFLKFAYHMHSLVEFEYAAILSLIIGCFGTLRQFEIKRFLAYSSITHMGFLLAGDSNSLLIYLLTYALASFAFFIVILSLHVNKHEFTYLTDLRLIASAPSQIERLLLLFALSSMAGLPPFSGFFGKIIIWISLIEDIYLYNDSLSALLLLVNLVVSLIIIFYYIRLVILLFVGDEQTLTNYVSSFEIDWSGQLSVKPLKLTILLSLVFWTFIVSPILGHIISISESVSLY